MKYYKFLVVFVYSVIEDFSLKRDSLWDGIIRRILYGMMSLEAITGYMPRVGIPRLWLGVQVAVQ